MIKSSLIDSRKHEIENVLPLAEVQEPKFVNLQQKGVISSQEAEKRVIETLTKIREVSGASAEQNKATQSLDENAQEISNINWHDSSFKKKY